MNTSGYPIIFPSRLYDPLQTVAEFSQKTSKTGGSFCISRWSFIRMDEAFAECYSQMLRAETL